MKDFGFIFMKVFFYFIFLFFFLGVFFVYSHTAVLADSVVATVTILPGPAPAPAPKIQPGTTFIAPSPVLAQPVDSIAPLFIFPAFDQIKPNSFFDDDHLVQFVPASLDSLTLHWYSNEAVRYSFAYGETDLYEIAEFSSTSFFEGNFVQTYSLVPGKTYFGKIIITDHSGNNAAHIFSFIVPSPLETEEIGTNIEKTTITGNEKKKSVEKLEKKEETLFTPEANPKIGENLSSKTKKEVDSSLNFAINNRKISRSDREVIRSLITKLLPNTIVKMASTIFLTITKPILPQIKTVRSFFNNMNLPSTPVFIMPSTINLGYNVLDAGFTVARGLLLETKSLCTLVGVDEPPGIFVFYLVQLLECRQ